MSDITYNQQWDTNQPAYASQMPNSDSPQQPGDQSPNKKLFLTIGLIAIIILLILFMIYLIFGRSATPTVSPEVIKKNLPVGPPAKSE